MKLFLIVLAIVSSSCFFNQNSFFIGFNLVILCLTIVILKFRNDRKFITLLITIAIFFSCINLIHIQTFQNQGNYIGIIIKKTNSYVILTDGIECIKFNTTDNNLDLFDIIRINSNFRKIDNYIKPIEQGFDFTHYFNNVGVYRESASNEYSTIFNFPINVAQYKIYFLSKFKYEKSRYIANAILFGDIFYDDILTNKLKSINCLNLLATSGIFINSYYSLFYNIVFKKIKNEKKELLSFLFTVPLFLFNLNSFSIVRLFVYRSFKLICTLKKIKLDELTVKSASFCTLFFANKYTAFNIGIRISVLLSYGFFFSNLLFKKKTLIPTFLLKKLFIILMTIPISAIFSNSFNVLSCITMPIFMRLNVIFFIFMFIFCVFNVSGLIDLILMKYYNLILNCEFKYFTLSFPFHSQYTLVLYYSLIFLLFYFLEVDRKNIYKKIIEILTFVMIATTIPNHYYFYAEVSFINVGQGDSTLISYRNHNILVDTGGSLKNDLASECLIPFLRMKKIYKIDAVYITHYDLDHCYALKSLKDNFIIKDIYDYNNCSPVKNDNFSLYNINTYYNQFVDENNKSLVLKITIKNKTFLIMGDASSEIEKIIIKHNRNLQVDYLKVGHHGSATSTSEDFIETIKPKEAIISCGEKNIYGHPHKNVIDILKKHNVKIRKTCDEGTITYKIF